jgi:hypothetical protein
MAVAGLLLLSLLVGQALAGAHRHDQVGAEQRECAACLVAHAPTVGAGAPPSVVPPLARTIRPMRKVDAVRSATSFPHAVPLACGPPA